MHGVSAGTIWFTQQALTTHEKFGLDGFVIFVLFLGRRICGGDALEYICFGLNSMVINFSVSLWVQPKFTWFSRRALGAWSKLLGSLFPEA